MERYNSDELIKDVEINRSDLETEICTTPAKLAFYIEQAALWNEQARTAKVLRDNRASELYLDLKSGRIASESKDGKTTEGYIDAVQKLDLEYQKYDARYASASAQAELFEGAVTALIRKHDSLRSLNKNSNAEQSATNSFVASSAEERAVRRERVVAAQG